MASDENNEGDPTVTETLSIHTAHDPKYDNWPVEYTGSDPDIEPEWIGTAGAEGGNIAIGYNPETEEIYEGDIDEKNEIVRLERRSERQPKGDETLGNWIRRFSEETGWSVISTFGLNESQEKDDDTPKVIAINFQERNTLDPSTVAFFGSYIFQENGKEWHIEREFEADIDTAVEQSEVTVAVDENVLDAVKSNTTIEEEHSTTFTVNVEESTNEHALERRIENQCKRWHESHPGPL